MCEPKTSIKAAGLEYIATIPEGEACLGITKFEESVIVCCTNGVYELMPIADKAEGYELVPIRFVQAKE